MCFSFWITNPLYEGLTNAFPKGLSLRVKELLSLLAMPKLSM